MNKILLLLIILLSTQFAYSQPAYNSSTYNQDIEQNQNKTTTLKALFIAVILPIYYANDIYFRPLWSFKKYNENGLDYDSRFSFDAGLRVSFKESALEYGVSHLVYESKVFDSQYNEIEYWGLHINYLQNIFYNNTPEYFNIYVGPTVNYVSYIGIGAITGVIIRVANRLKIDLRYEISTETNHIQLGLIFTFNRY